MSALLVPPLFVTVTLWSPGGAVDAIEKAAVIEVELVTETLTKLIPIPASRIGAMKFVPVSVTTAASACTPLVTDIPVNVGTGGKSMVNGTVFVSTPPNNTCKSCEPKAAKLLTVNLTTMESRFDD